MADPSSHVHTGGATTAFVVHLNRRTMAWTQIQVRGRPVSIGKHPCIVHHVKEPSIQIDVVLNCCLTTTHIKQGFPPARRRGSSRQARGAGVDRTAEQGRPVLFALHHHHHQQHRPLQRISSHDFGVLAAAPGRQGRRQEPKRGKRKRRLHHAAVACYPGATRRQGLRSRVAAPRAGTFVCVRSARPRSECV